MKYILIILIIIAFVIGIFDLKFMLKYKKEQKNNKAEAFIYVGDKKNNMDIWNSVLYN